MTKTRIFLSSALLGAASALALPLYAANLYIDVDPPYRRAEHFDARPGYVVVPGAWQWNNGRH
jgi:hypothetical protein